MLQQKDTLGKKGEALAYSYLKSKGYKIIAKNYKNFLGEIDIIAKDKDYTVFIEVKTRMSRAFGDPLEAIDETKQLKIRRVATMYLKERRQLETNCRFDMIAVLGDNIEDIRHIENAF